MQYEINRRDFLKRTSQLAALGILGGNAFGDSLIDAVVDLVSPESTPAKAKGKKKGFGVGVNKDELWRKKLTELRPDWFYTWGPFLPEDAPAGMEFVPLVWGSAHVNNQALLEQLVNLYRDGTITALLGFNEPDQAKQGNIPVADLLDLWPKLMELNMPLGSPGFTHPDRDHMKEFMAGVDERGLRVDFVSAHSYGGPNAQGLVDRMKRVYEMFGRPVWITEFAVGDWKAITAEENSHSPERVLQFMEEVLPLLDQAEFVHRYCWFSARPTSAPLGTSALFDREGNLTPLGECYRDA